MTNINSDSVSKYIKYVMSGGLIIKIKDIKEYVEACKEICI